MSCVTVEEVLISAPASLAFEDRKSSKEYRLIPKPPKGSGARTFLPLMAVSSNWEIEAGFNSKGKAQSEILARIKQNVKLCNKNKLKMKFIFEKNKRDSYDLKSLGLVLGMPTWMTKNF